LDKSAADLVALISQGPALTELPLAEARKAVDAAQAGPIDMPDVEESWLTVAVEVGEVQVLLIKPRGASSELPVVLYMHGGGWILGSIQTHGRLVRELAVETNCAVAFIDYARAPEAKYPVQIEQCYAVARWVGEHGASHGLDPSRIAVAGDSAGGNMATVLALMAKQRGDVRFVQQSMYYPMTDALTSKETESYRRFKDGPYGSADGMNWFWDSYLAEDESRDQSTVSPLRASRDELEGLPSALVIVDENDILRDQGEAYADKLREAGVPTTSVRFNGTIHDFMRLNPLHDSESTRAAMTLASWALRRAFDEDSRPGPR
jgi:acetyl esterase/lipase